MNVEQVQHDMEVLGKRILTHYTNVNRGGCGVIAYYYALNLQKHFPVRIRVGDWHNEGGDISRIREYVSRNRYDSWRENGVRFGHIFVEVTIRRRKYYIDTDNFKQVGRGWTRYDPAFGFKVYSGELTLDEMKSLINQSGWNTAFDRRQIPRIKKTIKNFFEHEFGQSR